MRNYLDKLINFFLKVTQDAANQISGVFARIDKKPFSLSSDNTIHLLASRFFISYLGLMPSVFAAQGGDVTESFFNKDFVRLENYINSKLIVEHRYDQWGWIISPKIRVNVIEGLDKSLTESPYTESLQAQNSQAKKLIAENDIQIKPYTYLNINQLQLSKSEQDHQLELVFNISKQQSQSPNTIIEMIVWSQFLFSGRNLSLEKIERLKNAQMGSSIAAYRLFFDMNHQYKTSFLNTEVSLVNQIRLFFNNVLFHTLTDQQIVDIGNMFVKAINNDLSRLKIASDLQLKQRQSRWEVLKKQNRLDLIEDDANLKLDQLVKTNNRKGVYDLLNLYLPWDLMEPIEKKMWSRWLELILSKPDKNTGVILYRGLADKEAKRVFLDSEGRPGMFSPILINNQGSYTRRLRSLSTKRNETGDWVTLKKQTMDLYRSVNPSVSVVRQWIRHADDPMGSQYISFSTDAVLALKWADATLVESAVVGVLVHPKMLIPNAVSDFITTEKEILLPLLVFPEDVVFYQKFNKGESPDDPNTKMKLMQAKYKMRANFAEAEKRTNLMSQNIDVGFREMFLPYLAMPVFNRLRCSHIF